jgi:pyruvate,orthophosphate dikinase
MRVFKETGTKVDYMVGTMIELPRAALLADQMAEEANSLASAPTTLPKPTMGLVSRRRRPIPAGLHRREESRDLTIRPIPDARPGGVGLLIQWAITKGRSTRPI